MSTIAVMQGDQTGQELLEQALQILDPALLHIPLEFVYFDLSLESRRATANDVVKKAASAMVECGYGLKAATITPEKASDVGSPNALLRTFMNAQVIVRSGQRIPGTPTLAGIAGPITVVRMAVNDAYGAQEWRETTSTDEVSYRTEHITRSSCRTVAEYAFVHAQRTGARVFGGPKYTVSPIYEGMLKEEMDAAAARHPDVSYEPQLIDATYALLFERASESLVIPALNRDGDCLGDLVLRLFGSIAAASSTVIACGEDVMTPHVVMTEAPHGTAPALQGTNTANPMAMILAAASLLGYMNNASQKAAQAIRDAVFDTMSEGIKTIDLGGSASTTEFTAAVREKVARLRQ